MVTSAALRVIIGDNPTRGKAGVYAEEVELVVLFNMNLKNSLGHVFPITSFTFLLVLVGLGNFLLPKLMGHSLNQLSRIIGSRNVLLFVQLPKAGLVERGVARTIRFVANL